MKKIDLTKLVVKAMKTLESFSLSKKVLYNYQGVYRRLVEYYQKFGEIRYSPELSESYLAQFDSKNGKRKYFSGYYGFIRRALRILSELYENKKVIWRLYQYNARKIVPTSNDYLQIHQEYLDYLHNTKLGTSSIHLSEYQARSFLCYLEYTKTFCLKNITPQSLCNYFPYLKDKFNISSMRNVRTYLICFLRYLGERDIVNPMSLVNAIPKRYPRRQPVIPVLSLEEMLALKRIKNVDNINSKRDYAMILLVLSTGLRSIDILHLQRNDIDWNKMTISVVQSKTGKSLVLPLLTEVGNALADYILNDRPHSDMPQVFLRSCAPYIPLSGHSACWYISKKAFEYAEIRQKEKTRKGFHLLRHSIATRLLTVDIPLPVISSILGHQRNESSNVYLSVDEFHLKQCALDLDNVPVFRKELQ